jgi:hypothetical protein
MGCDQNHAESMIVAAIVRLGGKHHGDVNVAGEACQPLGMSGVRKSCEMKGMLVGGGSDDRIYFATESQLYCGFHRVSRNPAGAQGSLTIGAGIPRA